MADLDRAWTQFALDAEVDHFGVGRIVAAHNALRAEVERLKAEKEQAEARLAKVVEAVEQAEADVKALGFEAHPAVTMRLDRLVRNIRALAASVEATKKPRPNVKKILASPEQKRELMTETIRATQAREGVETTKEQAEAAYDKVQAEKKAAEKPQEAAQPKEESLCTHSGPLSPLP